MDKRASTPSVKVVSIDQSTPAKQQKTNASGGTFKGKIEKKNALERNTTQCQRHSIKVRLLIL